ncbi:hypothetical protein ATCC51562_735 [Campylobacter concisus ATCC 51562]|uniref:Uncharacterized protein n=1 Tax=Campylobacter concisus ATCC 51562 TaxID=1242969 RepID=U2F4K7_9BACT|nr:hypothetical protein ATCC51562_735 [Campylobacter concisus ATCC 51562]
MRQNTGQIVVATDICINLKNFLQRVLYKNFYCFLNLVQFMRLFAKFCLYKILLADHKR